MRQGGNAVTHQIATLSLGADMGDGWGCPSCLGLRTEKIALGAGYRVLVWDVLERRGRRG